MFSFRNQIGGKKKELTPKQLKALEMGRKKLKEKREKNKFTGEKDNIKCRSKCKKI